MELKNVSYDANGQNEPTIRLFTALQNAYNYFLSVLFTKPLPPIILVLNRRTKSMGYFLSNAWKGSGKESNTILPELNINPKILLLPPIEVFQTLVHEMCHHFQHTYKNPGKRGYHNLEFSRIMFGVGLMCSNTGAPGGKITGRHMADYVIPGGKFDQAFDQIPKECLLQFTATEAFDIKAPIEQLPMNNSDAEKKIKIKYSCSIHNVNVWGKPGLYILCGYCKKQMNS